MHSIFLLSADFQIGAILIALLVLALLIFWEIKRNRRAVLRIILSILTVGSLLLIALQPTKQVQKEQQKAVFLTENYLQKDLDSLWSKYSKVSVIPISDLNKDSLTTYDTLHILGDGFFPANMPDTLNIPIVLSLNALREGFINFQYTKKVTILEEVKLQGIFYSKDTLEKKLILRSPKGEETIKTVNKIGKIAFNFQQKTAKAGRFLYSMIVENKDSILQEEVFPIIVQQREKLKVLILNEAPNFETKYLKNWLTEGEHSLAIRSTISKEKFNTEFINFPKTTLANLNQNLLKKIDVLVVTASTIHQLQRIELKALKKAIEQGLGMIVLPDERLFTPQLAKPFQSFFFGVDYEKNDRKELIISNLINSQKEGVTLKSFPYQAGLKVNILPVLKDDANWSIAVTAIKNQGRITSSIIPITYTLQLQGKPAVYNAYWSELFKATAPANFVLNNWQVKEELLVRPNDEMQFQLNTSEPIPIVQIVEENDAATDIFLQQNPINLETWKGSFWPYQTGWHTLHTKANKEEIDWFYVQPKTAWESMRLFGQHQMNLDWLERQNAGLKMNDRPIVLEREALPIWWFYLLFLLGIGGLWIEEKF